MANLGSVLSIARNAMLAQQNVIQTAGNNIANVQTEGYSAQRVVLTPGHPQRMPNGNFGTGVLTTTVQRLRDFSLDTAWRREASSAAAADVEHGVLSRIEQILGEPAEDGLAARLDAMWSAWSDLATQPGSDAARRVVLQRAQTVATQLNTFDQRLTDLQANTRLQLQSSLDEVNQLARTIATLNGEIASAEVGPHEAPDLRDQRDRAIDRLSKLGDVRVFNHPDGTAQITLGNNLLVDRTNARELVVAVQSMIDAADPTTGIAFADMPSRRLLPVGGQVSALVRSINDGVRRTRTDLDRLANGLARVVNQVVAHGETAVTRDTPPLFVSNLDGTFDRDADPFAAERFALDPTLPRPSAGTVTARTISLNQAYLDTPGLLPTSSSADRVTDNDVALAMAMLRDRASVTVGSVSAEFDLIDLTKQQQPTWASGPSLGEFYRGLASTLGATTRTAATEKTVRETLASQADARRQAVSGVNLDEELTTLMRAQQAYQAAAKVISAADEMLKVLTSMI